MNAYSNSGSSHVVHGGSGIEVRMYELLRHMSAMDAMLLHTFQEIELGYDAHITNNFFESLKLASTTPLFGPG